jgi:hypothetical protein
MNNALMAKLFPILRVRNVRDVSTQIRYMNGDSVQLQPNATCNISSDGLGQLPPSSEVEFISPTLIEMHEAGVIQLGRASAASEEVAPAAQGESPQIVSPTSTITKKKRVQN